MDIVLTGDQFIAKDGIIAFLLKKAVMKEDYFITLSGFAGTGKSTVVNHIIKELKFKKKIAVSATTHTAKENIAAITDQPAETIQSLLGLRPNMELADYNPNKPQFDIRAEEKIQYYEIVIIDESSMIGKVAHKLIEDKAIEHGVKILFVGDSYQLPPIGEVISPIFKLPNVFQLNEIVRQSNSNPNTKLIELARNDVRDNTNTFLPYLKNIQVDINEEEGFKLYSDKNDYYGAILEKYFDSAYNVNHKVMKTLAWTNKMVTATNKYVRDNLIKSKELVAEGDILMGYKTITKELLSAPWYLPIVKNSVTYKVLSVEIIETVILGKKYKGYKTLVKEGYAESYNMFILHRDSYSDFIEEYRLREEKGRTFRQWKQFYDFKDQIIVMETILDEFNNLVCNKDIDYGYAITVHKSQGATFENVGITLSDIMRNGTDVERRKLIYVAVSRTSKSNLLYV